jgi:hypothetical protein
MGAEGTQSGLKAPWRRRVEGNRSAYRAVAPDFGGAARFRTADRSQDHRRNRWRRPIQVPRRLRSLKRHRAPAGGRRTTAAPPEPHQRPSAERCSAPRSHSQGPMACSSQGPDRPGKGRSSECKVPGRLKRRLSRRTFQALVHDQPTVSCRPLYRGARGEASSRGMSSQSVSTWTQVADRQRRHRFSVQNVCAMPVAESRGGEINWPILGRRTVED